MNKQSTPSTVHYTRHKDYGGKPNNDEVGRAAQKDANNIATVTGINIGRKPSPSNNIRNAMALQNPETGFKMVHGIDDDHKSTTSNTTEINNDEEERTNQTATNSSRYTNPDTNASVQQP